MFSFQVRYTTCYLQANHLPYSLNFCRYPDDVILKLPIRMLNEKQKYRRGQLKNNMRQAALHEWEKGKEPGAVQGKKQEVMPGIPQKEKEVGPLFYYFLLLYVVRFK